MKNCRLICRTAIAIGLLCTLSSCTRFLYWFGPKGDGGGQTTSFKYRHAHEDYSEWIGYFPDYIIPRVCAYYQLHPERFKPTGQGEEIEIQGLAAFVKDDAYFKRWHRASAWSGEIRDPWGDRVHFVQDLNMDGFIEAGGERVQVSKAHVDGKVEFSNQEHHFGILKRKPFKGPYGIPAERIFAPTFYDARNERR
ncbi:MAG: hypothetical protein JWR69_1106 [Pedosphaera sp.]|nr:hypothetical protein [Pedosphaera sp.]